MPLNVKKKKKKTTETQTHCISAVPKRATIAWNNLKPYGLKNANAFIGMHETTDTPIFF